MIQDEFGNPVEEKKPKSWRRSALILEALLCAGREINLGMCNFNPLSISFRDFIGLGFFGNLAYPNDLKRRNDDRKFIK
jgi:hypothetical protein